MERFLIMLNSQLVLILFIGLGALLYHRDIITKENNPAFMKLVISYLLPIMTFNSFKEVTVELLRWSGLAILIGFVVYAFYYVVGQVAYRWMPTKKAQVARYATLVNNVAFAGMPLILMTYGDAGAIIASVFLIPHRLYMWIVGLHILDHNNQTTPMEALKRLITNPAIIAVGLGLARGLLQIQLPQFLDQGISTLAATVSPLAMMVIGSIIAQYPLSGVIHPDTLYYVFIRLIFIPVVVILTLKAFNIPETIIGVVGIAASMPAGTPTALLATEYGLDGEYGANITLLSILLSIITAPLVMSLL